jgi:hypothetical protein
MKTMLKACAVSVAIACISLLFPSSPSHAQQSRNLVITQVQPERTESRIALVIGNSMYKTSPLANPVNDAGEMAQALRDAGFHVIERENATQKEMHSLIRDFGDQLRGGGVGLFFYAGHGMQVKGHNYLIPVDAQIEREDEVAYNGIDANLILEKMESARNRLNVLILDACRNNPFARSSRSGNQGLAQMDAPVGTLIAFATSPGAVASDGNGKHGLYTKYLLEGIRRPGTKLEDIFKTVRASVRRESEGKQIPWEATSLEGDFYFLPPHPRTESLTVAAPAVRPDQAPPIRTGDRWNYAVIDLWKNEKVREENMEVSGFDAGTIVFKGKKYVTDRTGMNPILREKSIKNYPAETNIEFPIFIGKESSGTYQWQANADNRHGKVEYTIRVLRIERVTVPAGSFDAYLIEKKFRYHTTLADGRSGSGTGVYQQWYVPEVKRFVKSEITRTDWDRKTEQYERRELTSFSVK